MGTYTANYNLYMPTVGEQGWGEIVNNNFSTIDVAMSGLNTRVGTLETETDDLDSRIDTIESRVANGTSSISTKGLTNSGNLTNTGTITSTGLITANGGVKGNLTGNVTGFLFVKGTVGTSGDVQYASLPAISQRYDLYKNSTTIGIPNYSISYGNPARHTWGVYTRRSDLTGNTSVSAATRTVTITQEVSGSGITVQYYNSSNVLTTENKNKGTFTFTVKTGTTMTVSSNSANGVGGNITCPAGTTYYVKYATP